MTDPQTEHFALPKNYILTKNKANDLQVFYSFADKDRTYLRAKSNL